MRAVEPHALKPSVRFLSYSKAFSFYTEMAIPCISFINATYELSNKFHNVESSI